MDAAMPGSSALKRAGPALRPRVVSVPKGLPRSAGAAASLILLILSLRIAFGYEAAPAAIEKIQALLFGPLACLTTAVSAGLALAMFLEIVRAYRKRLGFPWFPSLCFAGSAFACLLALHACLG